MEEPHSSIETEKIPIQWKKCCFFLQKIKEYQVYRKSSLKHLETINPYGLNQSYIDMPNMHSFRTFDNSSKDEEVDQIHIKMSKCKNLLLKTYKENAQIVKQFIQIKKQKIEQNAKQYFLLHCMVQTSKNSYRKILDNIVLQLDQLIVYVRQHIKFCESKIGNKQDLENLQIYLCSQLIQIRYIKLQIAPDHSWEYPYYINYKTKEKQNEKEYRKKSIKLILQSFVALAFTIILLFILVKLGIIESLCQFYPLRGLLFIQYQSLFYGVSLVICEIRGIIVKNIPSSSVATLPDGIHFIRSSLFIIIVILITVIIQSTFFGKKTKFLFSWIIIFVISMSYFFRCLFPIRIKAYRSQVFLSIFNTRKDGEFCENMITEQITSFGFFFHDLGFILSSIFKDPCTQETSAIPNYFMTGFMMAIFAIRLIQAIKIWHLKKNVWPSIVKSIVNATAIGMCFVGYRFLEQNFYRLIFYGIAVGFNIFNDVFYDYDYLSIQKVTLYRNDKSKSVCALVILSSLLRFNWIIILMKQQDILQLFGLVGIQSIEIQILMQCFVILLECIRRTIWTYFILLRQHRNNCSQFNSIPEFKHLNIQLLQNYKSKLRTVDQHNQFKNFMESNDHIKLQIINMKQKLKRFIKKRDQQLVRIDQNFMKEFEQVKKIR